MTEIKTVILNTLREFAPINSDIRLYEGRIVITTERDKLMFDIDDIAAIIACTDFDRDELREHLVWTFAELPYLIMIKDFTDRLIEGLFK